MTRKHFNKIAEKLAETRPTTKRSKLYYQWESDVRAMADVCQSFNSNFDRDRFIDACKT